MSRDSCHLCTGSVQGEGGKPLNSAPAVSLTIDETMTEMIDGARRRVIVLAPAVTQAVAEALASKWQILPADAVSGCSAFGGDGAEDCAAGGIED